MDRYGSSPSSHRPGKCLVRAVLIHLVVLLILPGALACALPSVQQRPPASSNPRTRHGLLRMSSTPAHILWKGNPARSEVALTFDDGPQPVFTPRILAILRRANVKATFFDVGERVKWYPQLAAQEVQDGHEVENHTWSHPALPSLDAASIYDQLAQGDQQIQRTTDTVPMFFRPPYGEMNATVADQAQQLGLSAVMWSIDPKDWARPGADAIAERVLRATTNGSIILLHDGGGDRAQTVDALSAIISTLQQRGLQFVTIQQMLDNLSSNDANTEVQPAFAQVSACA